MTRGAGRMDAPPEVPGAQQRMRTWQETRHGTAMKTSGGHFHACPAFLGRLESICFHACPALGLRATH
eukprot:1118920-Pyramimonas_sp.AAC.1